MTHNNITLYFYGYGPLPPGETTPALIGQETGACALANMPSHSNSHNRRHKVFQACVRFLPCGNTTPHIHAVFKNLDRPSILLKPDKDKHHANKASRHWSEIFTDRVKTVFKERYGDLLIDLGYARDDTW